MNTKIKIAILGSTGSIGTQAFESLMAIGCDIVYLCAGNNLELLLKQAKESNCHHYGTTFSENKDKLKILASNNDVVSAGELEVCEEIENCGADVIIHSISGLAGLPYAFAAAKTGARIGMANKEVIISAGDLLAKALKESGGELIPVDSEHSAIFQCLQSRMPFECLKTTVCPDVSKIILTASGGPFYGKSKSELTSISAKDALNHPTWKMGGKITIDSATMMNKGFEVIEATRLFCVPTEQIEVVIHKQSVVHSMVEFHDRSILAQLGLPDMRTCIRYAVSYPERVNVPCDSLDLLKVGKLTFEAPDNQTFPLLKVAYEAAKKGGSAPVALIAADEELVGAFLKNQISFLSISEKVQDFMASYKSQPITCYQDVLDADREARTFFTK